jgi:hypothetical protein
MSADPADESVEAGVIKILIANPFGTARARMVAISNTMLAQNKMPLLEHITAGNVYWTLWSWQGHDAADHDRAVSEFNKYLALAPADDHNISHVTYAMADLNGHPLNQ